MMLLIIHVEQIKQLTKTVSKMLKQTALISAVHENGRPLANSIDNNDVIYHRHFEFQNAHKYHVSPLTTRSLPDIDSCGKLNWKPFKITIKC